MKYIAYCRKSTDEKTKQVLSIESQVAEIKEFAKREGLVISEWITESRTAKVPDRPMFAQALSLIEAGKARGLISWHPDRLARNSIDGGKIIYLLDTSKLLDLKFPSFWFENSPQGKFMLNIAFGQSKYYVDNLSDNVKRGNRQKLRNGVWPSKAPYGYLNDPQTRTITVDRRNAPIIKQAFEYFSSGKYSYTMITNFLAERGLHGRVKSTIHTSAIRKMLTNPFYLGTMVYGGEKYHGVHKQFIPKSLFDKVQEQVKFKDNPRPRGHNFSFTGLMKCGECGASITAEHSHTSPNPSWLTNSRTRFIKLVYPINGQVTGSTGRTRIIRRNKLLLQSNSLL